MDKDFVIFQSIKSPTDSGASEIFIKEKELRFGNKDEFEKWDKTVKVPLFSNF